MASLVAVPDLRNGRVERPIDTVEDKGHLQGVVKLPEDDRPRIPVDDRHQIHPPVEEPDIRDIDAPDMVRILGHDIAKKVGIDLVFQSLFTKVGARVNPLDPHLAHRRPNTIPAHGKPLLPKGGSNFPASVERRSGIDLIDPVAEKNVLRGRPHRLVIDNGSGDSGQAALVRKGEFRILFEDPAFSGLMAQLSPDFFLIQFNWSEDQSPGREPPSSVHRPF